MNLVEYAKITKCLNKLDKLEVEGPENLENLEGAKAILEDLIEFKIFPIFYVNEEKIRPITSIKTRDRNLSSVTEERRVHVITYEDHIPR